MTKRKPNGQFGEGNKAGGRPKGARNKATLAAQTLLDGQCEALTEKAVQLALEGDTVALKLCLDRIAPAAKDRPICFNLPEINSANDAARAAGAVLTAVAQGEVTPLEAAAVMGLIEGYRRTLETSELEQRIAALETE